MSDLDPAATLSETTVEPAQVATTRAFLFTVVLSTVCCGAIACGNRRELDAHGFVNRSIEHIWLGLGVAIPIGIAAWAVLRNHHRMLRFAVPALLVILLHVATMYGYRWNHANPGAGLVITAIDQVTGFATACLFFCVVRRILGWRIGPEFTGNLTIRLPHLFLWTSIAGLAFATIRWFQPDPNEALPNMSLSEVAIVGVVGSLLATACIGVVLDDRKRRFVYGMVIAAYVTLSFGFVGWITYRYGGGKGIEIVASLPVVVVVFLSWCFAVYRSYGYELTRNRRDRTAEGSLAGSMIAIAGCMLLGLYSVGAVYAFADERSDNAFQAASRAQWKLHGVSAIAYDGKAITGVHFSAAMPLTQQAVDALVGQPLRIVMVHDHAPEPGSLHKIAAATSMEVVQLQGSEITKTHLEELHDAKHLKHIVLSSVPSLTPTDIDKLRKQLPNCTVH